MKRIKSLILAIVGLLTAPVAFAQSSTKIPFTQTDYYAVDYGQWQIKNQSANTYLFSPVGLCVASASGTQFFPFATNAPVLINDVNQANSEVVTPSTATNNSAQCGFSATTSNSHTSFLIQSGTAGLQESLNALAVIGGKTTAYPAKIILDRNWFTAANSIPGTSGNTILGAAKGNAHAFVVDNTTAGQTLYVWSGTAYTAGTWVNTVPTAAAGAAAGTSPTVGATAGTALTTTQVLTTGTATTTGTLFTLTWASTAQFLYSPTCSVTSIGTNSFTAFTVATTHPSGALLTVTATTAPTASTAYKFQVSCF
jgi:hypothetical protein